MIYDAIVVASGNGKRADLGFNKVLYVMKNGKTVLENACHNFIEDEECENLIVVTSEDVKFESKKVKIVEGGKERYNSVFNGLKEVKNEVVLIHDGARPFLKREDLDKLKSEISECDGAILACKSVDTIKYVKDGIVENTLNRENIYLALTPQAFKTNLIKDAYNTLDCSKMTDDASLFEKMNLQVRIVEGDKTNIKLTNKEDFLSI